MSKKEPNKHENFDIGEDGFPVPQKTAKKLNRFSCICPICMSADATVKLAKSVNYIVRCPTCCINLYLNDSVSINLFRGMQRFYSANPEAQVEYTANIVSYAPLDGE